MKKKIKLLVGTVGVTAASATAVVLADAAQTDSGTAPVPAAFSEGEARTLVGPGPRAFSGAEGVTRVEGNGQVCAVSDSGTVGCGDGEGLDQAPIVNVTLAGGDLVEVSIVADREENEVQVTDRRGQRRKVKLAAGVGAVTVPRGNVTLQWVDRRGVDRSQRVPVEKMFPPVASPAVAE